MESQKTILKICIKKGFLLDREMLEILSNLDETCVKEVIEKIGSLKTKEKVITRSFFSKNFEEIKNVLVGGKNKTIIDKLFINMGYSRTEIEEKLEERPDLERSQEIIGDIEGSGKVRLVSSVVITPKKVSVNDFVNHFRARYNQIKKILQERNLEGLTSIRKIGEKRDSYTIIGIVLDKRITKNKNLLLEIEDLDKKIFVLANQNKKDVFEKAKELLLDDIVAFQVSGNSEMLFVNDIIFPDCFLQEKKKHNKDEWVAFTSDFHVGSSMFLEDKILRFIKWLNAQEGDEKQKQIAKKVKYLFVVGDNVDGVGVFPEQERLLKIKDIKEQYKKLADILKLIRDDIKIILCPGQHDAVWVGEPQPIISEQWAPDLYNIKNLILVQNPSLVEIDGNFRVLMYHGASMHGIIEEIEQLRLKYGHNSPTNVVKEMLKRRHLAVTHGSVDYIPNEKQDPLVISFIPDIVATGDLHRAEVSVYNNILLVASSCWQSITPFEERVGNHPEPAKVPLFNLKTREIKILDFSESEHLEEKECKETNEVCRVNKNKMQNENRD